MKKSNKSIAGYHLLMILSAVDNELEAIASLQPEAWKDHFEFHAHCFYDDSTEDERKRFIIFAKTLIKADNKVTDREHQFYKLLKHIWKIN